MALANLAPAKPLYAPNYSTLNQNDPASLQQLNIVIDQTNKFVTILNELAGGSFPFAEHITDTTTSTSVSTGSLINDGGFGNAGTSFFGGAANFAGTIVSSGTTDSTSSVTGDIKTAGGFGAAKAIFAGTTINAGTRLLTAAGTVSSPSLVVGANDNGFYEVSSTQLGASMGNALQFVITTTGVQAGTIKELVTGSGITTAHNLIRNNTLTALNSTGTVTAAMINNGGITSTSAAGVTATLDTAANIGSQIGAGNGTTIDFIVDNTAGANTVTVAVASGITAATPVITGGATLTVSVANAIGLFRLVFSDATTAKLYRIG